ncbi:DUF2911 domain-containing protein [Robiginitalea sp. IMCC43444]|uniref:DUF2911 domain-containing protein n=1 Tax=Robiginitalea sp. IMCC43444 TaxID=3459121 RepID=UPI004042ABF9
MKTLKWVLGIILAFLLLFYFVGMPYLREQTKKHSPEKTATYESGDTLLSVNYNSPSKKGRDIFGKLVPYGKVWRTGANEPTTFKTSTAIRVAGNTLPAGTYSLWTIPAQKQWTVIFNKEVPDWGVTLLSGGSETTRNPEADLLQIVVPVMVSQQPSENFLIDFEEGDQNIFLSLKWDQTEIRVPLKL